MHVIHLVSTQQSIVKVTICDKFMENE